MKDFSKPIFLKTGVNYFQTVGDNYQKSFIQTLTIGCSFELGTVLAYTQYSWIVVHVGHI